MRKVLPGLRDLVPRKSIIREGPRLGLYQPRHPGCLELIFEVPDLPLGGLLGRLKAVLEPVVVQRLPRVVAADHGGHTTWLTPTPTLSTDLYILFYLCSTTKKLQDVLSEARCTRGEYPGEMQKEDGREGASQFGLSDSVNILRLYGPVYDYGLLSQRAVLNVSSSSRYEGKNVSYNISNQRATRSLIRVIFYLKNVLG